MLSEIIVSTDLVHNKNLSTEAETAFQQWTHCGKFQSCKEERKKNNFFYSFAQERNEWMACSNASMQAHFSTMPNDIGNAVCNLTLNEME